MGYYGDIPFATTPLCIFPLTTPEKDNERLVHEGLSPQPHSWTCSLSGSPPDFELILFFLTYRLRLRLGKTLHLLSTELLRLGNRLTRWKCSWVNWNLSWDADICRLDTSEPDFPSHHEVPNVFVPRDAVRLMKKQSHRCKNQWVHSTLWVHRAG